MAFIKNATKQTTNVKSDARNGLNIKMPCLFSYFSMKNCKTAKVTIKQSCGMMWTWEHGSKKLQEDNDFVRY